MKVQVVEMVRVPAGWRGTVSYTPGWWRSLFGWIPFTRDYLRPSFGDWWQNAVTGSHLDLLDDSPAWRAVRRGLESAFWQAVAHEKWMATEEGKLEAKLKARAAKEVEDYLSSSTAREWDAQAAKAMAERVE